MPRRSRFLTIIGAIALWIGTIVVFILLAAGGVQKLTLEKSALVDFSYWGYPFWFMIAIGIIESVSAILLLIPRLALVGAAFIVLDMLGAIVTTVLHAEYDRAVLSAILAAISALILRARWVQFSNRLLPAIRRPFITARNRA